MKNRLDFRKLSNLQKLWIGSHYKLGSGCGNYPMIRLPATSKLEQITFSVFPKEYLSNLIVRWDPNRVQRTVYYDYLGNKKCNVEIDINKNFDYEGKKGFKNRQQIMDRLAEITIKAFFLEKMEFVFVDNLTGSKLIINSDSDKF